MTIYSPLVSGVRAGMHDDKSLGHIERRQTPFTHPMEDAMSPDQFDQLKQFLEDIGARLPEVSALSAQIEDLSGEVQRYETERLEHAAAADARVAAAEGKVAALENELSEAKQKAEVAAAKAQADLQAKIAEFDAAEQQIADLTKPTSNKKSSKRGDGGSDMD